MPNKQKPIISIEDMPIIVTVAVLVVGFGTVFGLIVYSIFGINQYTKPTIKTPSIGMIGSNYFGNEFIQIKSPQRNAIIKNPVLVSGKANVFEGNVRVRIKDENKNILADTFITASGAYDKLYLFEREISYTTPTCQNGIIEIFEENTKDGSDIHKVEIPVIFVDYADIKDETENWKTYRNEEYGFEVKYPKDWSKKESLYEASIMFLNTNKEVILGGVAPDDYFSSDGKKINPKYTDDWMGIAINVYSKPIDFNWDNWIKSKFPVEEYKDFYYKDLRGVKIVKINGIFYGEPNIFVEDEKLYNIRLLNEYPYNFDRDLQKDNLALGYFNQILSTFKFIEK